MRGRFHVAVLAALSLCLGASADQIPLLHTASIDLGAYFNGTSGYGDNPLSVAFDGTNAYVGGLKNTTGSPATVGVVRIDNVIGGVPSFVPLPDTLIPAVPNTRGIDALAFDRTLGALLLAHDSGSAASSLIRRHNPDGTVVWTLPNPQGARPFALAVDPVGNAGAPGVAFLTQGSGRRRLLSLVDGSTIYDGTNGGIVNTDPDSGSTWRAVAFDSVGNIIVQNQTAIGYGVRQNANQWADLGGTLNVTERSLLKGTNANLVGQGVAILEGFGSDLIAVSSRNLTQYTDALGNVQPIDKLRVHIRNLDGSTAGLTQLDLVGDENGIGTPWTGDIKNLAFGLDAAGVPTLLVASFVERRLDVYQIPEPGALVLLALGGLALLRRR